jgi:hypothetical protein
MMKTQEVENLKELLAYTRQIAADSDRKLRTARQFIGELTDVERLGGQVTDQVRSHAHQILQRIM